MSFLTPLFLLGAFAVAAPIVFHLIRRTSREKITFSSLMFLLPTPPRLTRRSRLENIFLLILRCAVLGLLALGFARPFFPQAFSSGRASGPGKRMVLLIDTSASMKRAGLWAEARGKAEGVLRKVSPLDQVAVFTFDRQVNRLVTFEQWSALGAGDRPVHAIQQLARVTPGWSATRLGNALVAAAEALEETDKDGRKTPAAGQRQIVLITDLQEGARLEALQAYEWPKETELVLETLKAKRPTNAGLQLVTDADEADKSTNAAAVRVRVTNAAESKREQFQVGWARPDGTGLAAGAMDVYVPPGQSRVVKVPPAPAGATADRVLLQGDDEDFDNTVYVVPPEASRASLLYLGDESEQETAQPLYFLKRAFPPTRRQVVEIVARAGSAPLSATELAAAPLIIAQESLSEERRNVVRRALTEGKNVLFVMKSPAAAATLAALLGLGSVAAEEAPGAGYAMLGEIDFQHPLFAPFADPRFSDFTRIHFWKHRRLDAAQIPRARVLARFDRNADPALLEVPVGSGRLFVLTSGWHPADSQLALSSKFVPLLYSLLEQSGGVSATPAQFLVGDLVTPERGATNSVAPATFRKPDGTMAGLSAGSGSFSATDQPGIYAITTTQPSKRFAVNLDPAESRTTPLPAEELERLGVPLRLSPHDLAKAAEQKRHLQNTELENRQKLWRWLVVTALVVLLLETWLAGRLTGRPVTAQT